MRDKWESVKHAAVRAGYRVTDNGSAVILERSGERHLFSKSEQGRITGYMQACVHLARQGVKPRDD